MNNEKNSTRNNILNKIDDFFSFPPFKHHLFLSIMGDISETKTMGMV